MRAHVVFTEMRARDPRMQRWVWIMAHTEEDKDQLLMVEDYAYVGTDFSGDPDLLLPLGGQWGDIGKKQKTLKWK